MKNLILGAVSALALSIAVEARAQTTAPEKAISPSVPATPAAQNAPTTKAKTIKSPAHKMKALKHHRVHPHHAHVAHHHPHHAHMPHHYAHMHHPAYVAFPCAPGCNLEYYQGIAGYSYVYHGGYFWYPQAHANAFAGYSPSYRNGSYWYPSMTHPHYLYVQGQGAVYSMPIDYRMHQGHAHPMQPLYPSAPVVKVMPNY